MQRPSLNPRSWLGILTLVLGASLSHAEMREFKSAQGTVIKAQLKKAKGQVIFLTNEAGKEVQVPLASFSKEDQNFILKWMSEDPSALDYNFICRSEEKLLAATKTSANAYSERVSSVHKNYEVSIGNSCRNTIDDLSIDWCAFMLNKVTLSGGSYTFSTSEVSPLGELRFKHGSEVIPKMGASQSHKFTTPSVSIDSVIDKYANGQKRKDNMQGVWLRFYRGDTMVGEWKSPECPKAEWPAGEHKSKAGAVAKAAVDMDKKNQTSNPIVPASPKEPAPAVPAKDDDIGDIVKIFQLEDKK